MFEHEPLRYTSARAPFEFLLMRHSKSKSKMHQIKCNSRMRLSALQMLIRFMFYVAPRQMR